jgi:hypothetical protein
LREVHEERRPAHSSHQGVPGQFDDLILRQATHGRTRDRASEPVPCLDELVLGPLVVLEGEARTVMEEVRAVSLDGPGRVLGCFYRVLSRCFAAVGL